MILENRLKVKVLWLANWNATEIAEYLNEPIKEVEDLIAIFNK